MSTEAMLRELERAIGAIRETHEVPADFGGMARMLCFELIRDHGPALLVALVDAERWRLFAKEAVVVAKGRGIFLEMRVMHGVRDDKPSDYIDALLAIDRARGGGE